MNDISDTSAYMALAGTLFGGAGLKLIESFLGRRKQKDDAGSAIRTELRLEISVLRVEMDKLKTETARLDSEIDKWRSRYFALLAAVATNDQAYFNKVLKERIE